MEGIQKIVAREIREEEIPIISGVVIFDKMYQKAYLCHSVMFSIYRNATPYQFEVFSTS
jgi:hypothetical protein